MVRAVARFGFSQIHLVTPQDNSACDSSTSSGFISSTSKPVFVAYGWMEAAHPRKNLNEWAEWSYKGRPVIRKLTNGISTFFLIKQPLGLQEMSSNGKLYFEIQSAH